MDLTLKFIVSLSFYIFSFVFPGLALAQPKLPTWAVYYGNAMPPDKFYSYDVLVFDADSDPLISPLLKQGKTVLGYLSLGEVESYRTWYSSVQQEGLLLEENKSWSGSFFVDVRDPRWTKRIIEQLIPSILHKGFSGVFIDTLDNPAELERNNGEAFEGMTKAAARLVLSIRRHYPDIKIMLNRAYEILPEVGGAIDMVLAESLYTDYNFTTKQYQRVEASLYSNQLSILQQAAKKFPKLSVYTLDYWPPEDTTVLADIYHVQRENGFIPYVATVELDRLIAEPPRRELVGIETSSSTAVGR